MVHITQNTYGNRGALIWALMESGCALHCKNEYTLSNQKNCGNRLQAIILIKCNKLELSNN